MIVFVETNFVFELAFARDEHAACERILRFAENQNLALCVPAFSLSEPNETLVRRANRRKTLSRELKAELNEMARSKLYQESSTQMQNLTKLLIESVDEEKRDFDHALNRIVAVSRVLPLDEKVITHGIELQETRSLTPQDSIIYASVLQHLNTLELDLVKCFVTKNARDFATPDIINELKPFNCKFLTRFENALGLIESQIKTS